MLPAIVDVSMSVRPGASVALLGATGAGKSTLLQLVRGLLEPEMGLVRLDGVAPGEAGYAERRRADRPRVPDARDAALRHECPGGCRLRPAPAGLGASTTWTRPSRKPWNRSGLPPEQFGARHPYSLSGGEQRRLALAGVLAMRPRVLLLDEPFASLDPGARRELGAVLRALLATGMGMVLATHDVDQAWALCDERVVLSAGRVVAAGDWGFGAGGEEALERHRLRVPCLVELWRRLGRATSAAPQVGRAGRRGACVRAAIAQYYPADSVLHRLDPRAKTVAVTALAVALFTRDSFAALAVYGAVALVALRAQPRAARLVLARPASRSSGWSRSRSSRRCCSRTASRSSRWVRSMSPCAAWSWPPI